MSQSSALARGLCAASALAGAALLTQVFVPREQARVPLREQAQHAAQRIATVVGSSLEHSMTIGDPLDTRTLVERIEGRLSGTEIEIYDHRGVEVYGAKPKVPHPRNMKPGVVATLTDRQRRVGKAGWIYRPIKSEARCASCHADRAQIRGVLAIELAEDACAPATSAAAESYAAIAEATAAQLRGAGDDQLMSAWNALAQPSSSPVQCPEAIEDLLDRAVHVSMLARQGRLVTELLDAAASTATIQQVALYDNTGRLYWKTRHQPPPPAVADALSTLKVTNRTLDAGASEREQVVLPLLNQDSCARCHGAAAATRGAIAVTVKTPQVWGAPAPLLGRPTSLILRSVAGALLLLCSLFLLLRLKKARETSSAPQP